MDSKDPKLRLLSDETSSQVAVETMRTGEIDLFDLWDLLWGGRWLILAVGAACTALALIYALLATEIYEAKVVVFPAEEVSSAGGMAGLSGQFNGLASLAGMAFGRGNGRSAMALAKLDSLAFTREFVQRANLLPVLFAEKWDNDLSDWRADLETRPTLDKGARFFLRQVRSVQTDRSTGILTISVRWTDPETAADWANALIEAFNEKMRQDDIAEAMRSLEYLKARVQETPNVDMRSTLFRLIEAQTQTVMLANVRQDYVYRIVDPAVVPVEPSSPRRVLAVALGVIFGGVLGTMLVFARSIMRRYRVRAAAAEV